MTSTATSTDADGVQGLRVHSVTDDHVLHVVLHGESDFSTLPELDRALADLTLDGARLVHLDLAHLAFADVATIRRLAAFSGDAKRAGHEVTTSGAHHTLRTVADLLDAQDDLGLG